MKSIFRIFIGSPELDYKVNFKQTPQWKPVTCYKIAELINALKLGNPPALDALSAELLKLIFVWWVQVLPPLFARVNKSGIIPYLWIYHLLHLYIKMVTKLIQIIIEQLGFWQ